MDFTALELIKDRIAKLLRMAADASSPNEAAIAASRARKLMDKHQLDEYDIGDRAPEEFATMDVTRAYAALPSYIDTLAVAVAQYNDCQSSREWADMDYRMSGKAKENGREGQRTKMRGCKLVFKGYKSDVELAVQMMERLLEAANRLCKEYLSSKGYAKYPVRIGGQFKIGACGAIQQQLRSMTVQRQQLTSTAGTALVLVKSAKVDEHFGEAEYGKVTRRELQDNAERDAHEEGVRKGSAVEITPHLD